MFLFDLMVFQFDGGLRQISGYGVFGCYFLNFLNFCLILHWFTYTF